MLLLLKSSNIYKRDILGTQREGAMHDFIIKHGSLSSSGFIELCWSENDFFCLSVLRQYIDLISAFLHRQVNVSLRCFLGLL